MQADQRASVCRRRTGEQQAHCFDGLGEQAQWALRFYTGVGEVSGRAGPQAQRHASRCQLLKRHRCHGHMHRMHDLGTHRHQSDVYTVRCRQEHRSAADRIAQEQVAGDPQVRHTCRFSRLRLCTRGL